MLKRSREQRFWAKVDRSGGPDACWMWHGGGDVYGTFWWNDRVGGTRCLGAHRASYLIAHGGSLADGLEVCHHCDVPRCVNPAHLFLGTRRDNAADCSRKGRGRNPLIEANRAKTHCVNGHEYTPENTLRVRNDRWTERRCKTCDRAQVVAARERNPERYRAMVERMMARRKERGETPEQREKRLAYLRHYNATRRQKSA